VRTGLAGRDARRCEAGRYDHAHDVVAGTLCRVRAKGQKDVAAVNKLQDKTWYVPLTKEEAKEISGLEDHEFEKAYDKASNIADSVMQHEGEKMDKFLEHFAKEIDKYFDHYGGKLFK
jgi:hypothetical protein